MNKQILYLSLLCVCIIATVTGIRKEKEQEGLMDFGDGDIELNAPLAYERFASRIKNPDSIKNGESKQKFLNLTSNDTDFTPNLFNKIDHRKYYSDSEMHQDFKYFNNASNLSLYHHYNNQE